MTPRDRKPGRWRRLRSERPRPNLRRGVIILPSAFTLGNLFFGLYAMIAASRGDFIWAAWCIVIAWILDYLDGRVARVTRTGSAFGAELDSLTDAISFGVAPALILIFLYFPQADWSWVIGFAYVSAAVIRLARFNVEQGGEARSHFHGLPSPAAGVLLATHYPFTTTAFFQQYLAELPWPQIMVITTVLVSILMISHIPYAKMPPLDVRTRRGIVRTTLLLGCFVLAVTVPYYWFFPAIVGYALWGFLRSVFLGLHARLPERDPLLDEEPDDEDPDVEPREVDYQELTHEPETDGDTDGGDADQRSDRETDIIQWKERRS